MNKRKGFSTLLVIVLVAIVLIAIFFILKFFDINDDIKFALYVPLVEEYVKFKYLNIPMKHTMITLLSALAVYVPLETFVSHVFKTDFFLIDFFIKIIISLIGMIVLSILTSLFSKISILTIISIIPYLVYAALSFIIKFLPFPELLTTILNVIVVLACVGMFFSMFELVFELVFPFAVILLLKLLLIFIVTVLFMDGLYSFFYSKFNIDSTTFSFFYFMLVSMLVDSVDFFSTS